MASIPLRPARAWNSGTYGTRNNVHRAPPIGTAPPAYYETVKEKTSLDITQRLEKKLAELNSSESVWKRWIYELVTWIISALCMVGILFVLLRINNKSLAGRNTEIATFSVLSKLASAALLLPTSEALGQLKWNWFNGKTSKHMWDFEIFDKASRGAWGSILLLFRTKGRSLAALGALLTILLIATDTFFQQVVDYPERWTLDGQSSIARVVQYERPYVAEYQGLVENGQADLYLRPTLEQFFYDNGTRSIPVGNGTRPDIPISCPTSNCTFPDYQTLGVCSQCKDVSELLEFGCRFTRLDWIGNVSIYPIDSQYGIEHYPNGTMCGFFFNITSETPMLVSGYSTESVASKNYQSSAGEVLLHRMIPLFNDLSNTQYWDGSINFKTVRNPLVDVIVVAANDGPASVYRNETPLAQECLLSWCVKQLQSSYYYGTYHESVVASYTNTTPGFYPWTSEKVGSAAWNGTTVFYLENINISPPGNNETYGMDNTTHFLVNTIFDDILPSFTSAPNMSSASKPTFRYKTSKRGAPYTRLLKFNPWLPPTNLTNHFERMAVALTNVLRSSDSGEMIPGSAYRVETYISIQWGWLAFPFLLLLLTLVFLMATIIKTKDAGKTGPGVWKTSAMPTLIYSLPKDLQKQVALFPDHAYHQKSSADIRLRLHPAKGWRISGQPCSPDSPVLLIRSNQPPPGWI